MGDCVGVAVGIGVSEGNTFSVAVGWGTVIGVGEVPLQALVFNKITNAKEKRNIFFTINLNIKLSFMGC